MAPGRCNPDASAPAGGTQLKGDGFTLLLPPDWTVNEHPSAGVDQSASRPTPADGGSVSLTVAQMRDGHTPAELAAATKEILGAADAVDLDPGTVAGEDSAGFGLTLAGLPMVYRFVGHQGATYVIALGGGKGRIADVDSELNGYLANWRWTN